MAVIEVEGLRKRYGETVAVDGVDLAVEEGEVFGVLGRNGAGKTTLVETVVGLRTPDAGRVRVLGLDPLADRARLRTVVGVQLQDCRLPEKLRVGEAVALYRSFYRRGAEPDALLERLGLADKRGTCFEDLSGGQQQRLSVALALVGDPRIAVLDELTTGLDPQARREAWELVEGIRDAGVTVVLVTHVMEEAERLCDRIAVIDEGRLAALDSPEGLVAAAGGSQRLRLRVDAPLDAEELAGLPGVEAVEAAGRRVVVRGDAAALQAVPARLAELGVEVRDLRVEQPSLDDAFLSLTGGDAAEEGVGR